MELRVTVLVLLSLVFIIVPCCAIQSHPAIYHKLFILDSPVISRVDANGESEVALYVEEDPINAPIAFNLAFDGVALWFIEGGAIKQLPDVYADPVGTPPYLPSVIWRSAALVSHNAQCLGLLGEYVYWDSSNGTIVRTRQSQTNAVAVNVATSPYGTGCVFITGWLDNIYWIDTGGRLLTTDVTDTTKSVTWLAGSSVDRVSAVAIDSTNSLIIYANSRNHTLRSQTLDLTAENRNDKEFAIGWNETTHLITLNGALVGANEIGVQMIFPPFDVEFGQQWISRTLSNFPHVEAMCTDDAQSIMVSVWLIVSCILLVVM